MTSDEYMEFSAKTIEDAVTEACQKLSVPSDRLEVEVVDQGSSGFLGFNARPALIRVRMTETSDKADKVQGDVLREVHTEESAETTAIPEEEQEEETAETKEEQPKETSWNSTRKGSSRGGRSHGYGGQYNEHKTYVAHSRSTDDFLNTGSSSHERRHDDEPKVNYTEEQISTFEEKAKNFLESMFQAMNMEVQLSFDFDKEENILTIDFEGDDMGILIGKRGQTLDSIQYLVSLVANKGIPGYVHVKTDTENYRERRRKTLENLARNMASKVRRTRKAAALEPMNPYERRIIHSALQADRYVTTYSEGEDPYRHVVIAPKK